MQNLFTHNTVVVQLWGPSWSEAGEWTQAAITATQLATSPHRVLETLFKQIDKQTKNSYI